MKPGTSQIWISANHGAQLSVCVIINLCLTRLVGPITVILYTVLIITNKTSFHYQLSVSTSHKADNSKIILQPNFHFKNSWKVNSMQQLEIEKKKSCTKTSLQLLLRSIFLDITPCSLLKFNESFRATCGLHLQGQRKS
jgi:hypothetical protein